MRNTCSAVATWSALFLCLGLAGGTAAFGAATREVKSVAQINLDEEGRALSYPSALFYDGSELELYLVNGGTSRVVVYGPDFFPLASMGAGHGVDRPRGGYLANGLIYVCQSPTPANPARITVLNGAFFPVREIFLDEIPGAEGFRPSRVAVSRDGLLYVTGDASRGVLVLDQDGTFLRRLEPQDEIFLPEAVAAVVGEQGPEEAAEKGPPGEESSPGTGEEDLPREGPRFDIPEEFRPKSRQEREAPSSLGLGPVRVGSVTIDAEGKLYLLSAETSKVYVYDASETFLFSFGEKGGTPGKLSQPRALAIDEKRGFLYVVDYMRHTILVYDRTGKLQFELGGRGTGPGWFNFPVDIVVNPQGLVIVADLFNRRVQVLEVELMFGFAFPEGRSPTSAAPGEAQAQPAAEAVERISAPEEVTEPPPPGVEEEVRLPE